MKRGTHRQIGQVSVAAPLLAMMMSGACWAQTEQVALATPAVTEATAPARAVTPDGANLQGYDFGHVLKRMETSVNPLQQELDGSFRVFVQTVDDAQALLEQGRSREAVQKCTAAIDGVLAVRKKVLDPMWEGQTYLTEQTATIRNRLAKAVENSVGGSAESEARSKRMETMLDGIAGRIADEKDPVRKKRLVVHYGALRKMVEIARRADSLSPDQKQLWGHVLTILEEAALAHQQVTLGSETLYSQFEATSQNLKDCLALMDTVDGAAALIKVFGSGDASTGMAGFSQSMQRLQNEMQTVQETVTDHLQGKMADLETRVEMIQDASRSGGAVVPAEIDAELSDRISRVKTGRK